jgi:hypothetical protein
MKHKAIITIEFDNEKEEIDISCSFDPEHKKDDIESNKAALIAARMLQLINADAESYK